MRRTPFEIDRPSVHPIPATYAYTSDHGVTPLGGSYPATQALVADLMKSWSPDYYLFGGDNAYMSGTTQEVADAWEIWEDEIADEKVWAVLGNHDLDTSDGAAHVAKFPYFPGNRRYFVKELGPVAFVMVNSGISTGSTIVERDGVGEESTQWKYLAAELAKTKARWKVVIIHHSPYTSASSYGPGNTNWRIPWNEYGIDLVLSGHSHNYERLKVDETTQIVAGVGGASIVGFGTVLSQSQKRVSTSYGALKITATHEALDVSFRDIYDDEKDFVRITKTLHPRR